MSRVLVIEPNEPSARKLCDELQLAGHVVTCAASGKAGIELIATSAPDVVVTEMALPDMPGTELCRELRARRETKLTPILMLSANSDEIDRIVSFEVGADDFVAKPYSVRELVLRVRALLRRRRRRAPSARVEVGGLVFDQSSHQVSVDGADVALSALEFRVLKALHAQAETVLSRTQLLEQAWGATDDVSERTVDACVKRLRRKLGSKGEMIRTVRGVGYRFIVPR